MAHYDVIVIGAGPAGCAAARALAACAHRVLLVDRPGSARPANAESIPPSARKTLAALGLLDAVNTAGFHPWRGNTVWWGDAAPRIESFAPADAGHQVVRSRFDALLRGLAAEAGADVHTGLARDVTILDLDQGETQDAPVAAVVESGGQSTHLTASFVLDCSGRAGLVARKGLREAEPSHHTVALVGVWRATAPWPASQETHTLVASYADGWSWSVPTEPGVRYISVMVDPVRTNLARGAAPSDVYLAELRKVIPFAPLLQHAQMVDGPWGADASLYAARRYAGSGFLLVGDAASAIDPLSSFGVKKALASGWLAAIAVNTALTHPAMTGEALAFFDRRERAVCQGARAQAARFAAGVAAGTDHPFWRARSLAPDAPDSDTEPDPAELARDPRVLAALDDLRRRPAVHLRAGDQARMAPRAAVRGWEIVMEEHLFLPSWPEGERYLRAVDLVDLVQLAPEHTDVGALCDAFERRHPNTALPDFLGALAVLIAQGGLRHT